MKCRRIAIGLVIACWGSTLAGSAEGAAAGQQIGSVLAQKLAIEQQLTSAINRTLAHLVGSKRAYASVSVDLQGQLVARKSSKRGARAMSFTVGTVSSQKYVKLPGLPRMRPGKIAEPVRIRIDPRKRKQVTTSLIGVVQRIRVRLYADPKLDTDRLKAVKEAISALVGLDKRRGDTLDVLRFTFPKLAAVAKKRAKVEGGKKKAPVKEGGGWLRVAAVPTSLVLAALILGMSLMRRRSAEGGAGGRITEHISRPGVFGGSGRPEAEADGAGEGDEPRAARAAERRAKYLPAVAELSTAEVAELLHELDDQDAGLVLALAPLSVRDLGIVIDALTKDPRFSKIAAGLAVERSVDVEKISALAGRVDQALERVRNPKAITVGAPGRLGNVLRRTSRRATRDVLIALEKQEPKLSAAVRERLFQFEDLPQLPIGLRRRLVTAIDTEDLAKALVGANSAIRESITGVLSKRLERIFKEEQQAVGELPEAEVERAREQLQRVMQALESEADDA